MSQLIATAVLFLAFQFFYLPVHAENSCSDLFKHQSLNTQDLNHRPLLSEPDRSQPYGSLRKDFIHTRNYTVEVKNQSEVKNQCHLGTCHLYSLVSMLEQSYQTETGDPLKISNHYLVAQWWLQQSLQHLNEPASKKINLASSFQPSKKFMEEVGILPDQAWQGRRDFEVDPVASRISDTLNNLINRAKYEITKVSDPVQKNKIKEVATNKIKKIFKDLIGLDTETHESYFWFEKMAYTPKSFQKTFFNHIEGLEKENYIILPEIDIEKMVKRAKELIDSGQNAFLAYDHQKSYVDKKSGIMSISAFNLHPEAYPLTRAERIALGIEPSGHAVQIVGYEADFITGEIIKWKIKNSWGTEAGDQGYYHMYSDYFREFALGIGYFE